MINRHKESHSFEERKAEATKIKAKYQDRIPLIIEFDFPVEIKNCKTKYLAPKELLVSQLMYVIRKKGEISAEKGIFLFCGDGNTLPLASDTISMIYDKYVDDDGFLYFKCALEQTFGSVIST